MKGSSPWKTPKRCAKTPSETPLPAHSSSEERENAAAWQKLFHELPFASPTVSTLGATPQEKAESVAHNEWLRAAPNKANNMLHPLTSELYPACAMDRNAPSSRPEGDASMLE